jgi:hypothetical protein
MHERQRASELLTVTNDGVDPGRQLITVVRKGQPGRAGAAGLQRRVRVASALSVEMDGLVPDGPDQPLWSTLR